MYDAVNGYRRLVALSIYGLVAAGGYLAALVIRFDLRWPPAYSAVFLGTLALLVAIRVGSSILFRLSLGRWRFISTRDVARLGAATATGTVVFYLLTRILPFTVPVPRSIIVTEWVLTTFVTAAIWLVYRSGYEWLRHHRSGINGSAKRVLVVGAGEAGNLLAKEMLRSPAGYRPVGFVDDDRAKVGARLQGLPVLGRIADVAHLVEQYGVSELHIAVPSASPDDLRRIVAVCKSTGRRFKVLPGIAEVLAGDVRVNHLRDVRIEDLLGRPPVKLKLPELAADLAGRSVLITGAAGSIGSELARQVALHGPRLLVCFDQAETELFYLEMELRRSHPEVKLVALIGDIVDAAAVDRVFRSYRPDRVFHAAAYKHVPMMEANPREAFRNNVIGTWRVGDSAGRHGAGKFVLVSTDKAVHPANIMGATKRLAEVIGLELGTRYVNTAFMAVRFGNVLGSNGSVIPVFQRQLTDGHPLTVTHPEATRYFMTIQEAVQLILQASVLPEVRGGIAMLEMGEPMRISDLARKLLELSGVQDVDDHIVYTGLRPGERLHEELIASDEEGIETSISKVHVVASRNGLTGGILGSVLAWERALGEGREVDVMSALSKLFPALGNGGGRPTHAPLADKSAHVAA